jgi:hypothetical protein
MNDVPRRTGVESRLDRAIDRAVRDMMQADPRPGFRGRVLSRLHREPVRSSLIPRLLLVGAALAIVLFMVLVATPDRRPDAPSAVASTAVPLVQGAPATGAVQTPRVNSGIEPTPGRAPARRKRGFTSEPIAIPPVANVFGNRNAGARAASVTGDAIWPEPLPKPQDNPDTGLPPLVVPSVPPPAPIVIPPIGPRGPGMNE